MEYLLECCGSHTTIGLLATSPQGARALVFDTVAKVFLYCLCLCCLCCQLWSPSDWLWPLITLCVYACENVCLYVYIYVYDFVYVSTCSTVDRAAPWLIRHASRPSCPCVCMCVCVYVCLQSIQNDWIILLSKELDNYWRLGLANLNARFVK